MQGRLKVVDNLSSHMGCFAHLCPNWLSVNRHTHRTCSTRLFPLRVPLRRVVSHPTECKLLAGCVTLEFLPILREDVDPIQAIEETFRLKKPESALATQTDHVRFP